MLSSMTWLARAAGVSLAALGLQSFDALDQESDTESAPVLAGGKRQASVGFGFQQR